MMLSELFERLSLGVLSNLAIGGEGSGTIPVQHQVRLALFANTALQTLYARFNLLERELVLRLYTGFYTYDLKAEHADTADVSAWKFIEDNSGNIFTEDVVKVLQIFNEDGDELNMNDPGDETAVYTPTSTSLLVPFAEDGDCLHVLYQAKHPVISRDLPLDLTQAIILPEPLVPALEAHIAYQVFSSMNGQEHSVKAAEYLARFDAICLEAEVRDLASTSLIQTHTKLEDRGFI
jgi:hypothetical protein